MGTDARARRDGLVYLVLAVGGLAGALLVAYGFGLGVPQMAAAVLPSLGGLYLSWAAFRSGRLDAAARHTPQTSADQLAVAVRGQWESEVRVRRLNDPYPLPVARRAAGPELGESWPLLQEMATAWPGGPPSAPDGWAESPEQLAGAGAEIAEVFLERLPTRRLLVLGEPGTGKTMLLVRLLLALLERRADGSPVPVLFPLASWSPGEQSLESWMAERLARDYAGLGGQRADGARELLEHGLILPVLDGFDEIPPPYRGIALDELNAALPLGRPVVLSSRVNEYRQALSPPSGVPTMLSGAAAVELLPLRAGDAAGWLLRDAGGRRTQAADRWAPVIERLGTDDPVAGALDTPLMLFLARTVYNPRPGERATALPDPAQLCDRRRFPDRAAVRAHLLDAFLAAAYRPHPRYPCRWSPEQARRTLTWLAGHLQGDLGGTPDIGWWQLHRALPPRVLRAFTGVLLGVVAWLTAGLAGWVVALWTGLPSGWLTGPPAAIVGGLAGGMAGGTAGGLGCGLVAGVTGGVLEGVTAVLSTGRPAALLIPAASGLAYGFAGGAVATLTARGGPRRRGGADTQRRRDWRPFAGGLVCGGALWFAFRPAYGSAAALAGALLSAGVYATGGWLIGGRGRPRSMDGPVHDTGPVPAIRTRWAWDLRGFAIGLAGGSAIGLTHLAALRLQSWLTGNPSYTLGVMLAFSCAYGLAVGLVRGLRGESADLATAVGPKALLAQDRRTWRWLWTAVGTAVGMAFLLCYGAEYLLVGGMRYGIGRDVPDRHGLSLGSVQLLMRVVAYGVTVGLGAALGQTAWWYETVSRHSLAVRRRMPRNLPAFLADAHEHRGALRQVGSVYQFRHIDLQHRLAQAASPRPPAAPRARPVVPRARRTSAADRQADEAGPR
ncbi:NACHT domain-containing protein [Streptomyces sp. NPDC051976]|uniref:NACHT domain-containing protein n=1 Tax=Streptomyces sp. NPDC051976 TaxID=3154947 RepID=UPI003414B8D2